MIHLRPVLGALRRGGGRLGDYWLHEESPGMYRISNTDQDATLVEEAPDMWRMSNDPVGTGAIISLAGFFRIYG